MLQFGPGLAEASTRCHRELFLCLIFLTNTPPTKDTLTQRQTLVSPTQACSSPPSRSLSSLSPPLPTQACDVIVSDNEVRTLLQQSVSLAPVCEGDDHSGLLVSSVVSGALCCLPWAHSGCTGCSLGPPRNALQSGRSRVDLRMTSRE